MVLAHSSDGKKGSLRGVQRLLQCSFFAIAFLPDFVSSRLHSTKRYANTVASVLPDDQQILEGDELANNLPRVLQEESTPVLHGSWTSMPEYPILDPDHIWVGECQGGLVGEDLVVVGGFVKGWGTTRLVQAIDMYDNNPQWRRLADFPFLDDAPTHAGFVVVGKKFYMCGGYLGMHPGPEMAECFVFDLTNGDPGVWGTLPSLPQGRGGGSLAYLPDRNALVFSLGADRPFPGSGEAIDHDDTWTLLLDDSGDPIGSWTDEDATGTPYPTIPYAGNHVSSVVIQDCSGEYHTLFVGGQEGENQSNGNMDHHFEFVGGKWESRAKIPSARGHTASSTIAYSCGFLMIGGSLNSGIPGDTLRTREVYYYDYDRDDWTLIGNFNRNANTPVCDVALDVDGKDLLFCGLAYTVKSSVIEISGFSPPPGPTPTPPTPTPPSPTPPTPTPGPTPTPPTPTPPSPTPPSPTPPSPTPPSPSPPSLLYKVNCGGPADAELGWIADDAFTSSTKAVTRTRSGFRPDEYFPFNTARRDGDAIIYNFPAPDDHYQIHLYFTEGQSRAEVIGGRLFDVTIGTTKVLENYDIYDAAVGTLGDGLGAEDTAVIEVFDVEITGGNGIDIVFDSVKDDAKVNGIVIYAGGGAVGPTPSTPTPVATPVPTPAPTPAPADPSLPYEWVRVEEFEGTFTPRYEHCFVMVNEKGVMIGGRGNDDIDIYDPSTQTWEQKPMDLNFKIHHLQCVAVDSKVYMINGWTGSFPYEENLDQLWVYDTETFTWEAKTALPEPRRRGSGAAAVLGREIYVSHGNRGGHGEHAEALGWLDIYNVDTDTWRSDLPDAPNPRDHTGGAFVADDTLFCVGGGRASTVPKFKDNVVLPTDCFNLETQQWEVHPDIPQGRAGGAFGQTCDGELMVAGGEGFSQAWDNVDVYDGTAWTTIDPLNHQRHGSGIAVSCTCNQLHIASGAGDSGNGNPELYDVETLVPGGVLTPCVA